MYSIHYSTKHASLNKKHLIRTYGLDFLAYHGWVFYRQVFSSILFNTLISQFHKKKAAFVRKGIAIRKNFHIFFNDGSAGLHLRCKVSHTMGKSLLSRAALFRTLQVL